VGGILRDGFLLTLAGFTGAVGAVLNLP